MAESAIAARNKSEERLESALGTVKDIQSRNGKTSGCSDLVTQVG